MPSEAVERIARAFHDLYETWARVHGWETQEKSRTSFDDLPAKNKATMISTVEGLLDGGVIASGAVLDKIRNMLDQRTKEMLETSKKAAEVRSW